MNQKRIKILCPIDRLEEALPLIEAGVDEFYCGVLIDGQNFGSIRKTPINRKSENSYANFNIPTFSEFEKLVKLVKKHKKNIFLTLNLPVSLGKIDILKNKIERIKELKVDGVILVDLRLVDLFKNTGIKMIASSILSTMNKETVEYLTGMGFKRIILSRQISLVDLKLIKKYPKIEFETFIMYVGCRSLPFYCEPGTMISGEKDDEKIFTFTTHPCSKKYKALSSQNSKTFLNSSDKDVILERLTKPNSACGACAIYQFKKYGVDSLKIVGRGFTTDEKIIAVKFTKECISLLDKCKNQKTYCLSVRKLFENTFNKKCNCEECYYPHFFK